MNNAPASWTAPVQNLAATRRLHGNGPDPPAGSQPAPRGLKSQANPSIFVTNEPPEEQIAGQLAQSSPRLARGLGRRSLSGARHPRCHLAATAVHRWTFA